MARLVGVAIATTVLGLLLFERAYILLDRLLPIIQDLEDYLPDGCNSTREFKWELIPPSSELKWVDCFNEFTCARLEVPLNYSDPFGAKAAIALIRQASPLPSGSSNYAGPILYNPGGPGGSGIDSLRYEAESIRGIVGPTFDLVSFDPRGIGASTPCVNFFYTEVERQLWRAGSKMLMDEEELPREWAQRKILEPLIEAQDAAGNGYMKHINTENTARDMLLITEKYGWLKLKYHGFSYGSVLGLTFASLFPDRIERMIVDGVVDTDDYYAGLWVNSLLDTDATMQSFFDACHTAGPSGCPLWMSSPALIEAELEELYTKIRREPIAVHLSPTHYGIVDYEVLRMMIFRALYYPWDTFPKIAQALADLKNKGDGRALFDLYENPHKVTCSSCDPNQYADVSVLEGIAAVACNDGMDVDGTELESFLEYSKILREKSVWAEAWERIPIMCVAYPDWGKQHFQGPVVAQNTSHPILLISNTADPVTPLAAAKKMNGRFPGSVLLTQKASGHCSSSAPSVCTARAIRAYLTEGTLPEEGTVCDVDSPIFPLPEKSNTGIQQVLTPHDDLVEERELRQSVEKLARSASLRFGVL
ncbi:TAP-like protein-domain-containing protein [Flagelloscypha sp. PMI_526]|nr:TAP-like protein-domain-containing protein [Flagelloscypha sp. PMI_526]